ncbi:MAG: hypothetical protein ACP5KI_05185 [Brevinematia bacterium]
MTTNTTSFIPTSSSIRELSNTNYVCEVIGDFTVEDNKISVSIHYCNFSYTDLKDYEYYTNFEISF